MSAEVSEERKKLLHTIYNKNMLDKIVGSKRKATDSPDDKKSTKRLALEMCVSLSYLEEKKRF